MNVHLAVLSCFILSCGVVIIICESNEGKCVSLVDGPFDICTKAGYNNTLPFPKELTAELQTELAGLLAFLIYSWRNCSSVDLAAALECSFLFPKCSAEGRMVLPCRRVCGELLKQCYNHTVQTGPESVEISMNIILSECLALPDEKPSTKKCFEPPNFSTNDSVKSEYSILCSVSKVFIRLLWIYIYAWMRGWCWVDQFSIGDDKGPHSGCCTIPMNAHVPRN